MKRTSILIVSIIFLTGLSALAEGAARSYRVSATIPAIIGINAFPEEQEEHSSLKPVLHKALKPNQLQDITLEEIVRNDQKFFLRTIVAK